MTAPKSKELSRRGFIKCLSASAMAGATLKFTAGPAAASEAAAGQSWGTLIDLTRCTGCESCVLACKQNNRLPNPEITATQLDSDAYTCLEKRKTGPIQIHYVKRQCMHCLHPACVSACTVGALRKTAAGPVVYDDSKCIGCRYCQYACPFGVPTFDWESPLGLIHKCQFCQARLDQGQKPACAEACPNGALRCGRREELLAQARAQIISNPGRYVDHIYGEHEAGGTSMLYLSAIPFAELGFPELGSEPIPQKAENVMAQTPLIALTVAAVASSLAWFLQRREKLAQLSIAVKDHQEDQA